MEQYLNLGIELTNLNKDLKTKEDKIVKLLESIDYKFTPNDQLKKEINNKDLTSIYTTLSLIALRDRSFSTNEFINTLEYVKSHNIPDFIKPFDGRTLEPKEKWNEDYWAFIVASLVSNFSEERIRHLKEVSQYLYSKDTYKYQFHLVTTKVSISMTLLSEYEASLSDLVNILSVGLKDIDMNKETNKPELELTLVPTEEVIEAVANKDLIGVKGFIILIGHKDRLFSTGEFDKVLNYIKQKSPELIEAYDKRPFKSKEEWDEEYYETILYSLNTNFSLERINHLKEISKYLYSKNNKEYFLVLVIKVKELQDNYVQPNTYEINKSTLIKLLNASNYFRCDLVNNAPKFKQTLKNELVVLNNKEEVSGEDNYLFFIQWANDTNKIEALDVKFNIKSLFNQEKYAITNLGYIKKITELDNYGIHIT